MKPQLVPFLMTNLVHAFRAALSAMGTFARKDGLDFFISQKKKKKKAT